MPMAAGGSLEKHTSPAAVNTLNACAPAIHSRRYVQERRTQATQALEN